jgi:FKBP-type peptidyl-prolyl cis-trans isomerase 2
MSYFQTKGIKMSTVEKGTKIKVHYKGTLEDGTEFDNSKKRGSTLDFEVGAGLMIKGFDENVLGMGEGEVRTFTLEPEEAYGPIHRDAFTNFPKERFGEDMQLEIDGIVQGQGPNGEPVVARITEIKENFVTLDFNHPLAGKNLTFEVELIEIEG